MSRLHGAPSPGSLVANASLALRAPAGSAGAAVGASAIAAANATMLSAAARGGEGAPVLPVLLLLGGLIWAHWRFCDPARPKARSLWTSEFEVRGARSHESGANPFPLAVELPPPSGDECVMRPHLRLLRAAMQMLEPKPARAVHYDELQVQVLPRAGSFD